MSESRPATCRADLRDAVTEARRALDALQTAAAASSADAWLRVRAALGPLLPSESGGTFSDALLENWLVDLMDRDFFLALLCLADGEPPVSSASTPQFARAVLVTQLAAQLVGRRILALLRRGKEVRMLLHCNESAARVSTAPPNKVH